MIHVPLGTVIIDNDSGEKLTEIIDEDEFVAIRGGKGGRGNWHFKAQPIKPLAMPNRDCLEKRAILR